MMDSIALLALLVGLELVLGVEMFEVKQGPHLEGMDKTRFEADGFD